MNFRLPFYLALIAITAVTLRAQSSDDEDDDSIDYLGYYSHSPNRIIYGYRMRQGTKIHFANVGQVTNDLTTTNASTGQVTYTYTNGTFSTDLLRSSEVDSNGKQTSTPGGTYNITGKDANGNPTIVGQYVSYVPGQTRTWSYANTSQISLDGKSVTLSQYTAVTQGANFDAQRKVSTGVELQLSHQLNSVDSRFGFSLVGGFSMNSINGKQAGTVNSTLVRLSDTYTMAGGVAVPVPTSGDSYSGPSFDSYIESDGTVNSSGLETTVPMNTTKVGGTQITQITNGAQVTGVWRVNGAYFAARFGPQVRTKLLWDIGLNAGAGLTAAYVGTNYVANEEFTVTLDSTDYVVKTQENTTESKFLPGYYANVDATWDANERTGFYAGVDYEALGSYTQKLAGRSAKIDIGNSVGIRGGVSIKF